MFELEKPNPDSSLGERHLNIDQQHELAIKLENLSEKKSPLTRLIFPNAAITNVLALAPLSFYTWRAGFRGYGLSKYGRGRILTVVLAIVYPTYGGYAAELWSTPGLLEPFRREDPWYHGVRFALVNQVGAFITVSGNICLSFLFASRSGLLPIPEGMHRPGVRQVATEMLLKRVKPYSKSIALSAVFSTALMFTIGVAAYKQSCSVLGEMNRKTLIYKEG